MQWKSVISEFKKLKNRELLMFTLLVAISTFFGQINVICRNRPLSYGY